MRSVLTPCHLGLADLLDGCLLDSRRLQAEYYDCWTVLARWGTRSPPDWDCVGLAADAQQLIAGIKQQLTLLCQNQPSGMSVEKRGVQAFFQRADLAADGRLRQMQRFASMGQAASIRYCVKYPQLVPVHPEILSVRCICK